MSKHIVDEMSVRQTGVNHGSQETGDRIGALRTPLGGLGPTTPTAADVAVDLDGDGIAEVLVYGEGAYHVFTADGADLGSVPARSEGGLASRNQAGGTAFQSAARWPSVAVADADGDGRADLLLPRGAELTVHFTGPEGVGLRRAKWALPMDLEPPKDRGEKEAGERRELEAAWFQDIDGDQRVDLLIHRWILDGSWFGARAEVLFCRGTGTGFSAPQPIEMEHAGMEVLLVDMDGDGDKDLIVPQVDLGPSNLARALLSKKVQVQVDLFLYGTGGYAQEAITLRRVPWPIEDTV